MAPRARSRVGSWVGNSQEAQVVTEHRCGNVRQQGPAAPAGWPCVVLWAEVLRELKLAATVAGETLDQTFQEEFGRSLSCR